MTSTVEIDHTTFEIDIEHFSFPSFHRISDMDELAKLSMLPRLRSASFYGTQLDDRGLVHICQVSTIENVNLQDTLVTNAGLAHVAQLTQLQYLRLKENRQLTNDCVPHILRMTALVDLQIHETSIEQQNTKQQTALPNLQDLCVDVYNGNYTFDGLRDLSARMPSCRILAKSRGEFLAGEFEGVWNR